MSSVDAFFDDKHTICVILVTWMLLISILFGMLRASHIQFFTFGPSPDTMLMGVPVDTWWKWTAVTVLTFFNTIFTEYVYDCLVPWIMTTIVDHKGNYIPYTKKTMLYIVVVCSMYRTVIQVVMIYIMLSQVDFLFVRVFADLIVTVITTQHFLRFKVHDPVKYAEESTMSLGATMRAQEVARTHKGPTSPLEGECEAARGSLDALLPV
eukprot:3514832-Rhodomonas_salina.3